MADMRTHTPSGAEVEIVSADEWADMSVTQLFDQRIVLANRLALCAQFGNPGMLKQISMGLHQIDAIIKYKEQKKLKNIDKRQRDITGLI